MKCAGLSLLRHLLSLLRHLPLLLRHNFRRAVVLCDLAGDADPFPLPLHFRLAELRPLSRVGGTVRLALLASKEQEYAANYDGTDAQPQTGTLTVCFSFTDTSTGPTLTSWVSLV